jgi:hypothetical protein
VARLVMLASTSKRSGALRSCDGLGSASSMSESVAGCVVRGFLVEGSSGEGRAFSAAMRAATRHAPFLLRQLAHFSSFGASRGHVPSFLAASLRFIGAKRPFAPRGHLRTAQLRTQRITEMGGKWSAFMCSHIPKIGGIAPVTLRYSDHECRRSILNLGLFFSGTPYLDLEVDRKQPTRLPATTRRPVGTRALLAQSPVGPDF